MPTMKKPKQKIIVKRKSHFDPVKRYPSQPTRHLMKTVCKNCGLTFNSKVYMNGRQEIFCCDLCCEEYMRKKKEEKEGLFPDDFEGLR